MRKNLEGNIHVYKAFWNNKLDDLNLDGETVDPLIVYADLLASNDVRNLETARMIYDKELTRLIRED
ncbi:MAG: hypothetical protein ISR69_12255 [Gammaproteobacteria bacterium]|nr:hypothetical protein [Gammaproteobacteria bacterium]